MDNFKTFLGENRDIVLTHQGKRYKTKHIEEVLYNNYSFDHGICHHCGCSGKSRDFVVKMKGPMFFLVHVWKQSQCDSKSEINSFETLAELGKYLRYNKQHAGIAKILHLGFDDEESGSSEESRSY